MIEIVALPSVSSRDELDVALCHGLLDVSRAVAIDSTGDDDNAWTMSGVFGFLKPTTQRRHTLFVALEDGVVVGSAEVSSPLLDNLNLAEVYVEVHPDHRRQGIGTTLLARAEAQAAAEGRSVWHSWATTRPPEPATPLVAAPTGDSIPADSPGWLFASHYGYVLEQVERDAVLDLPIATSQLEAWRADTATSTDGYRLHLWWPVPIPEEWLEDYALLRGEVPTEAPQAGLISEDQKWDVTRLLDDWQHDALSGFHSLAVGAEHIETGKLVAFTELITCDDKPAIAYQGYTYVQPPHRGHRLGLAVKAANLAQLLAVAPAVKRLHTDNAGENAWMLAINQTLGFRLRTFTGALQKKTGDS